MARHLISILSIFSIGIIGAYSSPLVTDDGTCGDGNPANSNYSFYTSRRLSTHFGIEAFGIDLSNASLANNPQFILQLKQDLALHRAILFRSQNLSGQQQVNLAEALGTIEKERHRKHPKSPHPYVYRVSNNETEGFTGVGTAGWHNDGVVFERPYMYMTMYFPSVVDGGDTYFIPLKELYDSFSKDQKDYYNKVWMLTGRSPKKGGKYKVIHPLVYKHPFRPNDEETMLFHLGQSSGWFYDEDTDSGGKDHNDNVARVINGVDTSTFVRPKVIQDPLTKKIESVFDEIGMRMKWQKGDFLILDNLGLGHCASKGTQGYSEDVGLRILERTAITGGDETVPSKHDGRRSFTRPLGVRF